MNNAVPLLGRCWRHLTMTRWRLRRAFPETTLRSITDSVLNNEQTHGGEIRVAIEADLSLQQLLSGITVRQRAVEVFAALGVWDTADRNGVLIYLCLADRAVEVIVDRALQVAVSDAQWAEVGAQLQRDCAVGQYQLGLCAAITTVGRLIGGHYPLADRNEQPDRPLLL
ncbi:MAG: TPM domain-containing protein [Steroidobacteraceae bacterium]